MQHSPHFRFTLAYIGIAITIVAPLATYAQAPVEGAIDDLPAIEAEQMQPTQTVTAGIPENSHNTDIQLMVGDIFEILPVHTLANATYTWILTQDRTFIEAMRTQTFRKRVIQPGRYSLFAEVASADGSTRFSKTFTLLYTAREPGQIPADAEINQTGSGMELVATNPPLTEGTVILTEDTSILTLTPKTQKITPLVLDVDINADDNGDGDTRNDVVTNQTFFQSDATPLYLWFTEQSVQTTMSVTAALQDGARVQEIRVFDAQSAMQEGMVSTVASIDVEQTDDRTYIFSTEVPSGVSPSEPLLYQWDFGDEKKSLLAKPSHTYAADGTYTVRLRIQSLTNGRQITEEELALTVSSQGTGVAEPETSADTPSEEQAEQGTGFLSSIPIGSVLLYGGFFIGALAFLFLLIFLLSRWKKGGNLSERLEALEESVVQKNAPTPTGSTPSTLAIAPAPTKPAPSTPASTSTNPPPEVAKKEEERTELKPSPESMPKANPQNAPTWLKSGLNAQYSGAGASAPSSAAPAKAPAPPAKQNPTKAAHQADQSTPATTPSWLKSSAEPASPPNPTPVTSKPAPAMKPNPSPMTAPTQATKGQPAPVTPRTTANSQAPSTTPPATVPAWLKTPSNTPTVPGATSTPTHTPNANAQRTVNPTKAQESIKPAVTIPPVAPNNAMSAVQNEQAAKPTNSSTTQASPVQEIRTPATAKANSVGDNAVNSTQSPADPQNPVNRAADTPMEKSTDEPIAIIRADSINAEKAQKGTDQSRSTEQLHT